MSEYIEREDAERVLREYRNHCIESSCYTGAGVVSAIYDSFKNIPAADVVEVVRCKDCVHYCLQAVDGGKYCELLKFNSFTDSGFCSYGERKDGADNDL